MKSILAAVVTVFLTPSVWANKYVCTSQEGPQLVVVLQSVDEDLTSPVEGTRYDYTLEVYKQDSMIPEVEARGTVETEDVYFGFESNDKKVSFNIYLDEMDQSSLTIEGQVRVRMTCY